MDNLQSLLEKWQDSQLDRKELIEFKFGLAKLLSEVKEVLEEDFKKDEPKKPFFVYDESKVQNIPSPENCKHGAYEVLDVDFDQEEKVTLIAVMCVHCGETWTNRA
jgi:hypothetical protein